MSGGTRAVAGNALATFPLFATLPEEVLSGLVASADRLQVPAGGVIMQEGTEGDGLYLLLAGRLEVSRGRGAGTVVLGTYGPGIFLGELSLLEHAPRSATVRALEPCELMVVPPAVFDSVMTRHSGVALSMLRSVIGRLRSTEAAVAGHARLVSLGTLAAGLAHEINNPAAALQRGLAQLGPMLDDVVSASDPAAGSTAARAELDSLLRDLRVSARAISDVVAAVRQHAAPAGSGSTLADVGESIDTALTILRTRRGLPEVRCVMASGLPPVPSRPSELAQLWLNLLDNAMEAAGPGGIVGISAHAAAGRVHVCITDDGPGIPDAVRPHIFDPFFTTRATGTGLGLHIVRGIVQRHLGSIDVNSVPGRTAFSVSLPATG